MYQNPLGPDNGGIPATCGYCLLMGTLIIKGKPHHACYRNWKDQAWRVDEGDHVIHNPDGEACKEDYRPSYPAIQLARWKQDALELRRIQEYLAKKAAIPKQTPLF